MTSEQNPQVAQTAAAEVKSDRRVPAGQRVIAFTIALIALGAGLIALNPNPDRPTLDDRFIVLIAITVAFAAAEATALHVEVRRQSHSLSLSSIPMMIGVLFLSPLALALCYVIGSVPAIAFVRRSGPVKATWNASLFFVEAAAAGFLVSALLGNRLPASFVEWLVPLGAVMLAELLGLTAVQLVIRIVDATFHGQQFARIVSAQLFVALAGTLTVTAAQAAIHEPFMLVYATVGLIGIAALLRSNGDLAQRYGDLVQLHGFTHALSRRPQQSTLDVGLAELVRVLRCRSAGLVRLRGGDIERSTVRHLVDDTFDDDTVDEAATETLGQQLCAVVDENGVTHLTLDDRRPMVRTLLADLGANTALLAPILTQIEHRGVLFVTDRLGVRSGFTPDEVRLFGSLAEALGARLSNDHLTAELEDRTRRDQLTGLPNRIGFDIALAARLGEPDAHGSLAVVDLGRHKSINDALGYDMGDRVVAETARRLQSAARGGDIVARIEGGRFAILFTDDHSGAERSAATDFAECLSEIAGVVEIEDVAFDLEIGTGLVRWPDHGCEGAALLHRAEVAMYEARRTRAGHIEYDPHLEVDAPRRLELAMSARAGLDNGEFSAVFQPKISARTGDVVGAEALARWVHPTHGPISPIEFVPLLTEAGLVGDLTRLVVGQAAELVAASTSAGVPIEVAVNLTPRDLLDQNLPDEVFDICLRAGVNPSSLLVEITEDAMVVDFDTSVDVIEAFRARGVLAAIDDFGTGYSSLQHIHRLPVYQLKIDRSFVSRVADDVSANAIVRATIGLASDLDLVTVAEGVEDAATADLLRSLGCDQLQGYHFSRPIPADEFMRWMQDRRHEHEHEQHVDDGVFDPSLR